MGSFQSRQKEIEKMHVRDIAKPAISSEMADDAIDWRCSAAFAGAGEYLEFPFVVRGLFGIHLKVDE